MKQPLFFTFGCALAAMVFVSCQPVEDDYGQRGGRPPSYNRKLAKQEQERKRELADLRSERAKLDKQIATLEEESRRAERNTEIYLAEQRRQSQATTDTPVPPPNNSGSSETATTGTELTPGNVPPVNPAGQASGGAESATSTSNHPDATATANNGAAGATESAKVTKKNYPTATAVPGKPGLVYSPFNNKPVDVKGIPSGTIVADPQYPPADKKHFRVP